MAGIDVTEEVIEWLKRSSRIRGRLARLVRSTNIPGPRLSLVKAGHQKTLNEDEWNALISEFNKDAANSPIRPATLPDTDDTALRKQITARDHPNASTTRRPNLSNPSITLHLEYPDTFRMVLSEPNEVRNLKFMGTTLRRLDRYQDDIRNVISSGGEAQVIFTD